MMINKLTASFGKLENETLSFHDGLNVIHAPNESGKSTWCAFIRAMLYGVDSGERARGGYLPDKQRYAPWSGAPMEGQMDVTADRCNITLTRTTRTRTAPMREFTATYTGTNVRVDGMTGANAGEQLTGVTRDMFRRSAFIEQGSVAVSGSPDLERRINAIVSTGEGMLPDLENKIEDARRLLEDMDGSAENIEALEQRLEQTKKDCVRLENEVTESRKRQRRESIETLSRGRAALTEADAAHDAAMERLSECRADLRGSAFDGMNIRTVEERVSSDLARMDELKAVYKKKASPLWMILCFLLTVAGVTLYTIYDKLAWIAAAGVFLIGAVVFLTLYLKAKRTASDARDERSKILKGYGVQHGSELSGALEEYRKLYAAVLAADGSSPAARLGRELNAKRAEAEHLSAQIATLKGRLSAMGDTMVLRSELGTMEEERALIEQEYEDISLAAETLRSADDELQSRFSPELGRVAAEYMSRVTGGRYSQVLINRDFSAMTRTDADAVAHDSGYLSAGTMDLLYLAVRLAVCKLALPEGEPCPLIIDDALVNLDETRLQQAMDLLKEIAKERQVILFTCRSAE